MIDWHKTLLQAQACITLDSAIDFIINQGYVFIDRPTIGKIGFIRFIEFTDTRDTLIQESHGEISVATFDSVQL